MRLLVRRLLVGACLLEAACTGAGGNAVDGRATVLEASNDLEKHSLDYDAILHSVSAQRRAAPVEEGRAWLVRRDAETAASTPE